MGFSLSEETQKFVEEEMRKRGYPTPDDAVRAAFQALEDQWTGDFAPGELDALLAEGEADIAAGRVIDGEEAFRQLRERSAARRREMGK